MYLLSPTLFIHPNCSQFIKKSEINGINVKIEINRKIEDRFQINETIFYNES